MTGIVRSAGTLCLAAVAVSSFAAEQQGENTPRAGWSVTKEAQKLLAAWRCEARAYRPRSAKMGFFSRAQLKYGAERDDFLHNWYDRPLHQNTSWRECGSQGEFLNAVSWAATAKTLRMGLMDGLAVCPTQTNRGQALERSTQAGGEMTILLELPYAAYSAAPTLYMRTAEQALALPNSYRIDGRPVLTRYPIANDAMIEQAGVFRRDLAERFGKDKFIVMYYMSLFSSAVLSKPLDAPALLDVRERLRKALRAMDGIFIDGWEAYWPRRYNAEFEREVVVPLLHSVMSEPEFAGRKYLGTSLYQGHVNCYRWGYSLDPNGTQMLADRLGVLRDMRPDFFIACEWDEQNENTHFRPTVSSGHVNMRLMRAFGDKLAGRPPSLFPGDRTDLPNLVLSYRKSLVVGEPVEAEVRNIPDGTYKGKSFVVAFRWMDGSGAVLREFPPQKLSADDCGAVRFVSPARLMAGALAASPELYVKCGRREWRFSKGLWPIDIAALRTVDFSWVRQHLREISFDTHGILACRADNESGTFLVAGSVESPVPLKSVEVLEGADTVFMADSPLVRKTNDETFVVDIQGFACSERKYKMNGEVRVSGAPSAKLAAVGRGVSVEGTAFRFANSALRNWPVQLTISMLREDVKEGIVEVDLPPVFAGRIKLADVASKDVVGFSGPGGGNLTVKRFLSQVRIPPPLGVKSSRFVFRRRPAGSNLVVRLQTVDADDHVWRSRPYVFYSCPTGEKVSYDVFERDEGKVHRVVLDKSLVPTVSYSFEPLRGSVIAADGAGREYWGILGGTVPQVTGYGRGESNYGNIITRYMEEGLPSWDDSAPVRVHEPDGSWALHFANCRCASLPQQLLPPFAAWELSIDVWPEDFSSPQAIVGCGAAGFELSLVGAIPQARYFQTNCYAVHKGAQAIASGPRLQARRWNKLRVVFDQKNLYVSVDGVPGKQVSASGYMFEPRYTALGAANKSLDFFRGKLRALSVRAICGPSM